MKKYVLVIVSLLGIAYQTTAQPFYFPERGNWLEKAPHQVGMDANELENAIQFAQANEYDASRDLRIAIYEAYSQEPYHEIVGPTQKRGGSAGLILKNGFVVGKWGDVERVDMTFSVTKSYLSTVAGLAVDAGLIRDVKDKVNQYVWDKTFDGAHNQKITWEHLLQQNSNWYGSLFGMEDWADRPPREGGIDDWRYRKLEEPGTIYEYNDVRVNVLAYALLQVWRKPLPAVLKEQIMDKIGASTTWRWYGYENTFVNVDGTMMQSVSGGGHSGGGLFINTYDHARFGLLFLRNGNWAGQQILSNPWIKMATQPSASNTSYGYLWWLNTKGSNYMEGVPETTYYAAGFGGNYIVVDKVNDLVVVTRWLAPDKLGDFLKLIIAAQNQSKAPTALFNGKNLDGWNIHGTEKWYVKDGILICESGPKKEYGYLATQQQFKNFDLTLEFKQEANGNSGVFFRSSLDGTRISGWQAEVAPPGNNSGGIYESYGRGWLIQPNPKLDAALKMGDWNTMRIRVVNDHVTTWLNGQQMIDLYDEKIGQAKGQIALQIHDGGGIKVNWRNLQVVELK